MKEKKIVIEKQNPYDLIPTFIKKDNLDIKNALVEVKELRHTFKSIKQSKQLYDGLNIEIYKNEKLAILGPELSVLRTNGAGSSLVCGRVQDPGKQCAQGQYAAGILWCFP